MNEESKAGAGAPWPDSGPGTRKVQGRSDRTRTARLLTRLESLRLDLEEVVLSPSELTQGKVVANLEVLLDGLIELSLLFRSHLDAEGHATPVAVVTTPGPGTSPGPAPPNPGETS